MAHLVVLDTHAVLWWASEPSLLSTAARRAIDRAARVGVPVAAWFEIATLVRRGRLELDGPVEDWCRRVGALPRVEELAVEPADALLAGSLPDQDFPGDPGDRLIYAAARARGAALITADRRLRAYDPAGTVW